MNILKRPIITEKSLKRGKVGIYVFEVEKKSKKSQIKKEIEKTFAVTVVKVSTIVVRGKTKRAGKARVEKKASDWKKAIVTLKTGEKIDLFPVT